MKMLMEIDPLSMIGSLVMTMALVSPSRREHSLGEQLRRSPRLVLPKFCLEMAALHPESFLLIFFQVKTRHIVEYERRGPATGPTRMGGAHPYWAHPLPRGPPSSPPVPIFCYMKSFTLEKKS